MHSGIEWFKRDFSIQVRLYLDGLMDAVCEMAIDIVRPSDPHFNRIPKKIKDIDRYWPYFKDCIGPIDGTRIPVVMPASKQIPYIGRKGFPTQNVMVVCDFNMCFTFA